MSSAADSHWRDGSGRAIVCIGSELMFGQVFDVTDIATVLLLVVLEGVMSIDNALVLGMLARRLPKSQRPRALTYGLVGAFVFRLISIATAQFLLNWLIVKLLGGLYLLWVAGKYFFFEAHSEPDEEVVEAPDGELSLVDANGQPLSPEAAEIELQARAQSPVPALDEPAAPGTPKGMYPNFWLTVLSIEMTDIAFAVDSIVAAIGVVGPAPKGHTGLHPKLWVVLTGGFLGVILMRYAATVFIKLLEKFPRFEIAAYLLVAVIGGKLFVDWTFNTKEHPHAVDFHSPGHPAFWIFWGSMLGCFLIGFIPRKKSRA